MTKEDSKHLSEELNLRVLLLQQRAAVLNELLLHTSQTLNRETAKFYVQVFNKYGNFFVAVTNSLKSSLYVELLSFLGVKINKNDEIINDKWADASLYVLAASHGSEKDYLEILNKYKEEIALVDEARHHIAHAKKLKVLNDLQVPGYFRLVDFINEVSSFLMKVHDELHGIPGYNKPHILNEENDYADDTAGLINAITASDKSEAMRQEYLLSKNAERRKIRP